MRGGDSLSLEILCQKYQAPVYSNYWKHQIFMLMLITGRRRKKRELFPMELV